MFRELSCPNCGAPGLETGADNRVVCRYCGNVYAESGAFCPNCRHVNREGAAHCEECGDPLMRSCPACEAKNWSGADYCQNCGRPLDILAHLAARQKQTTVARLNEAREMASLIKAEEEAASQRRMQELWEIERQRRQAVAEAAARQRERDRRTIQMIVAGVILFGLVLVAAGVILALR